MNRWVYVTIGTTGVVISTLEFLIADKPQLAYTILMTTALLISSLYLYSERRFYRQHNAIPASLQFILVPSVLLLFGNIIGPLSWNGQFIEFSLSLASTNLEFISTFTSVLLILPILMLFGLYNRFYDGRYPGFVIRRQVFGPNILPMTFQFALIALLITSGYLLGYIDVMALVFIGGSVVIVISKKIVPVFQRSPQPSASRRDSRRRDFLNSIIGGSRSRNTSRRSSNNRSRSSVDTRRRREGTRTGRSQIPTRASSGGRNVRTASSQGTQDVPVRSRSASQSHSSSSQRSQRYSSRSSSRKRSVRVASGIDASPTSPVQSRKATSTTVKKYLPKGNYSRSDLKCIMCYEAFQQSNGGNVVVCPNCKFPAHEGELRSWLAQSDRCPRCNKEVKSMGVLKTRSMIAVRDYIKIVKKVK